VIKFLIRLLTNDNTNIWRDGAGNNQNNI